MTDDEIVALWRQHKEVLGFAHALLAHTEHRPDCAMLKIPSGDCDCMTDRYLMKWAQEGIEVMINFPSPESELYASDAAKAIRERLAQSDQDKQLLFYDWPGGFPYKGRQ